MSSEVLIGGLVGSLLTIIVVKALDIAEKRREHRFSLQKSYFQKKLQAAETALAKWDSTASALSGLVALYERVVAKEKELEYELFRMTNESFIAQLKEIAQASNEIANIVLLYFDTDDTATLNSEAFKKFLDRLASIKSLDIPMRFALDFYEKFRGTHHEDEAWGEVERIMKEYQSCLKDLSLSLNEAHREMVDLIGRTRKAMKKYES